MAKGGFGRGGFGGIPGGNMQQLMHQAQKLQQQMVEATEALDAKEYTGTSGGGAITCVVNGKRQIVSLKIEKDVVDPEDVEMLEDMLLAAINDALKQGEDTREKEMAKLGAGSGMGGLF
ncbi:MAG: YbaB/EbfC family nucleoid-associated protein [Clostridia bacterium]|nr:YbaB/EbfC family nucleoid-associated protein [Clostridia bacterium]